MTSDTQMGTIEHLWKATYIYNVPDQPSKPDSKANTPQNKPSRLYNVSVLKRRTQSSAA
jgi:hypothetical protein